MGIFWGTKDKTPSDLPSDQHSYNTYSNPHDVPLPPSTHQSAAPSHRSGFFSGRHGSRRTSDSGTAHTSGHHSSSSGASTVSSLSSLTHQSYATQPNPNPVEQNTRSKPNVLQRTFGHGTRSSDAGDDMDPSIRAAHERVMSAESAERDADRALDQARLAVREARDHVRQLELEAKEEARRAKIKQQHAREVSRRGKALGRHDPVY